MEHLKPFDLAGKTILVTGASSGIGRQVAITCAQAGAQLVLTGRNHERLQETLGMLTGNGHTLITADLTDARQRESLVQQCPKVKGVFLSAGVVNPFPIKFISEEKFNETADINYKSVVLFMAALTRAKKVEQGGSVLFMSSISSYLPHKGSAMYTSTKAAIEAYSKVFALEYASQQIRSNVICAAMVKTPMYEYSEAAASKEVMDAHVNAYPLGVGKPEDIAMAALYFLSDASRWVTGTKLVMDGGFTLGGL